MSKTIDLLNEKFQELNVENAKFENGNSAAGTRARKALQEIKNLSQRLRIEIQEAKNKS